MQRFVDDELAHSPALIERALGDTLELLRESTHDGSTATPRSVRTELMEGLQRHGTLYRSSFVDSLQARVWAELARKDGGSGMAPPSGFGDLTLMDESRVEIDIEISRATQLIDAAAEWELRELQGFTSALIGQAHVSPESNPLRPMLYATALWDAGCVVHPEQPQRAALLRVAAVACASLLKKAWSAASTRLESQGVTPGVFRTVVFAPGSVVPRNASPAAARSTLSSSMGALLSAMPGGRDLRITPGGPSGNSLGGGRDGRTTKGARGGGSAMLVTPEFEQALARLEEILRHLPDRAVSKPDAAVLTQRMEAHRAALAASATAAGERQTIALLSRVFDAMLADAELHPSFVALVSRLQVSALRVALRDPTTVESTQHPMWQLLDRIGQASTSYPQAADPRGTALRALCQRLTEELTRAGAPDADLYRKALAKLDEFLAAQMQAQLRAAEGSVQGLRDAEKLQLLEQSMAERLVEQMEPLRPSPAVRKFISDSWSRVLAAALMRFGAEARVSKGYIKMVDDLLWSVQLPDHPASRQRLVALLPSLLQRLRSGMALIALPQAEQQAVLDELMSIHTMALRPGERAASVELTAEQMVQKMRDEVISADDSPATPGDSLIDLGTLQTVPAELMPTASAAPAGDSATQQIATLQPAERRRMYVNGHWACVQLLWRSDQGHFFLFAGELVGKTHSITRSALEKLVTAGLLKPLEALSLSRRALDSVSRQLSTAG